ncbi:MAG TPA: sensor histidine kinase [Falsiroseomonas sp.]|jgi:signal transduction histidine kinase|nr:sensor histidine kinase [Falsiroseomonas sp.]
MTILLSFIATMAVLTAVRLGFRLRAAEAGASEAERLAAGRGRCLSLAALELRGIAGAMTGCRRTLLGPGGMMPGLCAGTGGKALEGPAHQLQRLADDLADASARPDLRTIEEAPARLGPIVDEAVGRVGSQILPGRRYWKVDPLLRALTVKADRRVLEGALVALLRRAASHSRDGDLIALRWVVASEMVAIVVEDEGDGLAMPDLVPEPGATPAAARGLDLGLSLARSLAAAHGGDIRLESAPGIGARAWLTLPRTRLLEAA